MGCDELSHVLSPMSTAAQELVSSLKHINPISSTGHRTIIWQSQGLYPKKQKIPGQLFSSLSDSGITLLCYSNMPLSGSLSLFILLLPWSTHHCIEYYAAPFSAGLCSSRSWRQEITMIHVCMWDLHARR